MRGHYPLTLQKFKGIWQRGDPDNTPLDHFSEGQNIQPIGDSWTTRDGIGIHQSVAVPLADIKRIYNYPTTTGNTLLVLTKDGAGAGKIYHVVNAATIYGPILEIATMTDFAFVPYAGRAYITPFTTFDTGDINIQKGIDNEFLYVYLGAGVAARKAAGTAPTGNMTISN